MESSVQVLLAVLLGLAAALFFYYSRAKPEEVVIKKAERVMKTYTREEVSKHSSATDAWIIVKDKRSGEQRVYDVSMYIDEHPGGEAILRNAGQ